MKSIKKQTNASFLNFWGELWRNSRPVYYFIFIYFIFLIFRFDVYDCLDFNCWKRITVQCSVFKLITYSINFTYYNSLVDKLQDKNKSQVLAKVHMVQNTQYDCKCNCYNPVKEISYWLEYFFSKPFRTGAWRATFATIN